MHDASKIEYLQDLPDDVPDDATRGDVDDVDPCEVMSACRAHIEDQDGFPAFNRMLHEAIYI